MKTYEIKTIKDEKEIDTVPAAEIELYPWKCEAGDYRPKTFAKLAIVEGKGLFLKMTCFEANPRAEIKEFYSTVCFDSCLECFFTMGESGKYINAEMNSIGTSHIGLGKSRFDRIPVSDILGYFPIVYPKKEADKWSASVLFAFDELEKIFGINSADLKKGYTFKGNFYKCGDKTEIEHYGMWNLVEWPTPDFHRPEFFGDLIIK